MRAGTATSGASIARSTRSWRRRFSRRGCTSFRTTEIAAEFRKLRVIVEKTGGPAEFEAMDFLEARLRVRRPADDPRHGTEPAALRPASRSDVGERPPERRFGGVGLMIDQPGVVVPARPAESWQFEGTLASRAQVFAHRFIAGCERPPKPLQVLVEHCPAEHAGLGVGTQLGLAVGKALAVNAAFRNSSAEEIAARVGRGERSAIGVHGFDRGGLIVEPGKRPGEALSPLLSTCSPARIWRVAVFLPPCVGLLARHSGRRGVRRRG